MRSFVLIALFAFALSSQVINKVFVDHLKKIAPYEVYEPEENRFRDWTQEEIRSFLSFKMPTDIPIKREYERLNEGYDFRTAHPECMLGIRDQAKCGSCWAFA